MTGYNKSFIYFICIVSAMGGLLFGYDWVVIGGAVKFYEQFFGLGGSPVLQGIATSAALVGLAGPWISGGIRAVAMATPGITVPPLSLREFSRMPAKPPNRAMNTS